METTLPETDSIDTQAMAHDPLKEIKAKLADFLLALIQAFLRTGYYTPDHPQSKKAKIGLYEAFKNLFTQKDELTFLVRDDQEGKKVLMEGVLPESHPLESVMMRGMADLYTPKFAKFLERKDLISLTLKNTMSREEFTNFVNLMSEPTFVDTKERSDKERFSRTLQERGIFNISYIFAEELLAAQRKIPWRAQVALSRLNKDFKTIPLFLDLDEEGLKKVRRQIIQDVARPVQTAEIVYPILMNTDLAQTGEFTEAEIDEEIIACLSDELLTGLSKTLLSETLRNGNTETRQKKTPVIAKMIALWLNYREIEDRESILQEYFNHKLIPFELLSDATQRKAKLEKLTDNFLQNKESFFKQFDQIRDREKYLRAARSCKKVIPELIRRGRFNDVQAIIARIDSHFKDANEISVYAGQVLQEIFEGNIARVLKSSFLTGQKEIRRAIAPIFLSIREVSAPHLVSIFTESDDPLVRKDAWEILAQIDSSAINYILDELNAEAVTTESATDMLRILGEIDCSEWIEQVTGTLGVYLKHENPHLREEALWVYYKLIGGEGENLYLDLLNDPDIRIQKMAIQVLGRIKSETALQRFLGLLQKAEDSPSDITQQIEPRLFGALGSYGNIVLPEIGSLEDFLLETLDRRMGLGRLKFLKKKENPLSEAAVGAICETLGTIGTDKSLPVLQKLEKQEGSLFKKSAEEALRKITERDVQDN
jgi:HEAT repeat protein